MTSEQCINEIIAEYNDKDKNFRFNGINGKIVTGNILQAIRQKMKFSIFNENHKKMQKQIFKNIMNKLTLTK